MASVNLAIHILCVIVLLGSSLTIGLMLPAALLQHVDAPQRLRILAAVLERARGPVLGAIAGIFITGFFNMTNMRSGAGALLLIKMLLAVAIAGHGLALVNGVGGRLTEAAAQLDGGGSSGAIDWEATLERGERSCRRLALSQMALAAVTILLSLNL